MEVKMEIQRMAVSLLAPAPHNPRQDLKPGDKVYEDLKRSLTQYGCLEPPIWNKRTKRLIGGHQRVKVLRELGCQEVPVVVVNLPEEQEKLANVALNQIRGDWDRQKLALVLDEALQIQGLDVTLTGFSLPEIGQILDEQTKLQEDDFDAEVAAEAIDEPITKPGDLIQLGPHRLLCGDSANPDDVARLLAGEKADLVHMDPPYGVLLYGGSKPKPQGARPKRSRDWQTIYNDDLNEVEYAAWFREVVAAMMPHLAAGASLYIWNGFAKFGLMHVVLTELGVHVSCILTWSKPSFAIGFGHYHQQTEFCLFAWKKDGRHRWYGPANESTLWEISREPTARYLHPTMKPLAIPQRAIRNSSKRGDLVVDLFLGSGSTLIAAEQLGRRCAAMEVEPKWCDVAVRRYISLVGKDRVSAEVCKRYIRATSNVKP